MAVYMDCMADNYYEYKSEGEEYDNESKHLDATSDHMIKIEAIVDEPNQICSNSNDVQKTPIIPYENLPIHNEKMNEESFGGQNVSLQDIASKDLANAL